MTRVAWQAAVSPDPPPTSKAEAVWVENATITPYRTGYMNVVDREWRWVTGAVYDAAGDLVPQSQRHWKGDAPQPVAVDPESIQVPQPERTLDGRWVFAGHWALHFGHFLVEVLTNLWTPEAQASDGIVVMRGPGRGAPPYGGEGMSAADLRPWQAELLDLAGLGGREVMICFYQPVRVERLLVPERPVLIKHWVRPEALDAWRRVSETVGERGPAEKVFFSRSKFNALTGRSATGDLRTAPEWDTHLDEAFAAAGFDVVHPEELSVREQIRIVRGARVVAGSSGSALHLSCFAEPGTKVLVVGDQRARRGALHTQRAIDAACGHLEAFVEYGDEEALADLERIADEDDDEEAVPTETRSTIRALAGRLRPRER